MFIIKSFSLCNSDWHGLDFHCLMRISLGSQRVGHDLVTKARLIYICINMYMNGLGAYFFLYTITAIMLMAV